MLEVEEEEDDSRREFYIKTKVFGFFFPHYKEMTSQQRDWSVAILTLL